MIKLIAASFTIRMPLISEKGILNCFKLRIFEWTMFYTLFFFTSEASGKQTYCNADYHSNLNIFYNDAKHQAYNKKQ